LVQAPTPQAILELPYGDTQDDSETLRQIVNAASMVARRDLPNKREAMPFFDPLPKPETFHTNYNRSIGQSQSDVFTMHLDGNMTASLNTMVAEMEEQKAYK